MQQLRWQRDYNVSAKISTSTQGYEEMVIFAVEAMKLRGKDAGDKKVSKEEEKLRGLERITERI